MGSKKYLLGVTGGVHSGKSVAAQRLVYIGNQKGDLINHINTDLIGREIISSDLRYIPIRENIFDTFGSILREEDGSVNRQRLTEIIFKNKDTLRKFNDIIIPPSLDILEQKIDEMTGLILVESALFCEENFLDRVDYNMLLVFANSDVVDQRLHENSRIPYEELKRRVSLQFSNFEKSRYIMSMQNQVGRGLFFVFDTSSNPEIDSYRVLYDEIKEGFGIK